MENLKIEIKTTNDTELELIWHQSSMTYTKIYCTLNQLKRFYKIKTVWDITPYLLKQIAKEKRFETITTNLFNSMVSIQTSKDKKYTIQIEDRLALITKKETQEEMWCPTSEIKSVYKFSDKDWDKIKNNKKKMTPLSVNIQTNESDMGF